MFGYFFALHDNESYAFREPPARSATLPHERFIQTLVPDMSGSPLPSHRRCPACGDLLAKFDEPLIGLKIKKRRLDIGGTYDGVEIVSAGFKDVYESAQLTGLRFTPLPDDPTFFAIRATNIVEFDAERRATRFIKPCATCGRFESIVGATPVYLKTGAVVPDRGFAETDLHFGTADGKGPILLCGPWAGRVLKSAKLKGLDLVEF